MWKSNLSFLSFSQEFLGNYIMIELISFENIFSVEFFNFKAFAMNLNFPLTKQAFLPFYKLKLYHKGQETSSCK